MTRVRANTTDMAICTDCLLDMANGECGNETEHGCTDEVRTATWTGWRGGSATLGRFTDECGHDWHTQAEEHTEQCEQLGFSWSSCDMCGSSLGGDRHAATLWHETEGNGQS